MDLFEWAEEFVKFSKLRINSNAKSQFNSSEIIIEENKNSQKIITKYFIDKSLDVLINKHVNCLQKTDEKIYFICENIKKNIDILYHEWKRVIQNPNLVVIYVDLNQQTKWLIRPYSHNLIADPETLEEGLNSLYSGPKE